MKKDQEQEMQNENEEKYQKTLKRIKIATLLIIGLVGLALSVNIGVSATSTSSFCSSCHMMTPQALTWEASSHSGIECKDCHIPPGFENTINAKIDGLKELYYTVTNTYGDPIRMYGPIPDEACLKCHNMNNRDVTASGDIIIDHGIHREEAVLCVTCHDGVAHGKVSERDITYKTDYSRWDEAVASRVMADTAYTVPQMDTCMDCHELRRAPLTCETCHETGMFPESHEDELFADKLHGSLALEDYSSCSSCHSYMSKTSVEQIKPFGYYQQFLNIEKSQVGKTVQKYAKADTTCVDCHSERPDTHIERNYAVSHGDWARDNKDGCLTCHDNKATQGSDPVNPVTCSSCHPSGHKSNWQRGHNPRITEDTKINQTCFDCHVETTCSSCHTSANREDF